MKNSGGRITLSAASGRKKTAPQRGLGVCVARESRVMALEICPNVLGWLVQGLLGVLGSYKLVQGPGSG